ACFESANSPRAAPAQSILAGRRNVREDCRRLGLSLSRRRFSRRNDRVHAVAQTGPDRSQAVPPPGTIWRRTLAEGDQRRWSPGVPKRDRRVEAVRRTRPTLSLPNIALLES